MANVLASGNVIEFDAKRYRVIRHVNNGEIFTVEPVESGWSVTACILELALEHDGAATDDMVEKLAIESMPYHPRLWRKLPEQIRAHYRQLAKDALAVTRALLDAS